jgi:putative ABC transport system permease protein
MWKVTRKGLLEHRLRLALTALAVVLGVGFVTGTYVLTDTARGVFDDLVRANSQQIDVLVRGEAAFEAIGNAQTQENPRLDEALLADVAAVDGVAEVMPGVDGFAQIVKPDGTAITPMGPPTLGASWSDARLAGREIREDGRAPTAAGELVVDATTADRHGVAVGDVVTMLFATSPPQQFTVVGISQAVEGGADNLAGATLVEFPLPVAQEVLGLPGQLTSISVGAEQGVTPEELVDRIGEMLPAQVEVLTMADFADETMAQIEQALGFFGIALTSFGLIALVVGAYIIANTFSIVVVQRTREFALLRALGASRRQVLGSVVGEALAVGVLASAAGVGAGIGLAIGLRELLRAFGMDLPSGPMTVLPRTVVIGVVIGVVVTVVAALLPARRASRIHPMEALREASIPAYRPSRARLGLGGVAAVAAVVTIVVATVGDAGTALVGVGGVLALVALTAFGPLLTRPLAQVVSGPRGGTVNQLARGNVIRTPRRSWSTASALMIGLALVSAVAVLSASIKVSVADALERTMRADFVLTASNAFMGGTVPPVIGETLADRPELAAVVPLRGGPARIAEESTFVFGVEPTHWDAVVDTTFTAGVMADLAAPDTVAVDTDIAAEHGYVVGELITAEFAATGAQQLRLVGTYEPDELVSGWLISLETHASNYAQPLDSTVLLKGSEGVAIADVRATVEDVARAYPTVQIQDQAEYRDSVAGQIDQLLALITALLGMALLIAVLGIMNTLALSVHERTREIGLLRAVGMTRRQVRGMIRRESITVALLGAVTGTLLGVALGWALVDTLQDQGITSFVIPPGQLLGYVLAAGIAGVLAAVLPARSAARLDVLQAVTVE